MQERILVATDGTPASAGVLRMARLLADQRGSEVEVLTVYEPPPLYPVAYDLPVPESELDEYQADAQMRRIREQVREVAGRDAAWKVHARIGQAAPVIARRASEGRFSRILLGLGRHRPVDRWFGSETALRVIQVAHVPVLAVHPDASALPRRVLVAVDFSELSLDAARACLPVVADDAEVHLVHVSRLADGNGKEGPEWMRTYEAGAHARLEELARELTEGGSVSVHTSVLGVGVAGGAAQVLLEAAREREAELIAAGSHGLGFFGRVLMGSVSTRLLRGAGCSMLVVPPREVAVEIERMPSTEDVQAR